MPPEAVVVAEAAPAMGRNHLCTASYTLNKFMESRINKVVGHLIGSRAGRPPQSMNAEIR